MSNHPFSSQPTIVEESEEEEGSDDFESATVKEDYDRVPPEGNEVEDEDTDEAEEEWAQTPTALFSSLDQEEFWWVFVTLETRFTEEVERKEIPIVKERFDSYEDLVQAREETDEEIPEGIHVQSRNSNTVRYVKGEDERELLEGRSLV